MRLPLTVDLAIRSLRDADESDLVEHANHADVSRDLLDRFPFPYTEHDAREWIASATDEVPETSFAITRRDRLIGGIGLMGQHDVYRRTAELGYWLGKCAWGRGIGTLAVSAFIPWAFANFELDRIEACVFAGNEPSIRVLQKTGFQLEGRLRDKVFKAGKRRDLLIFARLIHDDPR